jgi:hypothetical protein
MTNPSAKSSRDPKSRRNGWIVIALVALGTLLFFVGGTMDPSVRYDWIGL